MRSIGASTLLHMLTTAGRRFPEQGDNVVAGALGKGPQITLLPFAALVVR
jgi:hypothetical protein